jgi:hypothetical protein
MLLTGDGDIPAAFEGCFGQTPDAEGERRLGNGWRDSLITTQSLERVFTVEQR